MIRDHEVAELLSVPDCIPLMEEAFKEFAEGKAKNVPRIRMLSEPLEDGQQYWGNVHVGCVHGRRTAVVRVDSNLVRQHLADGHQRMDFEKHDHRDWGLVYVYSLDTSALLGIVQEFTLSAIRVAATTAMAVSHLA